MGWDIILLNRFHDIIPGSAIGPVYDQTDREYEVILKSGAETALHLAEDLGDRICGQGKDTGREKPGDRKVIVINTQGYEREDTVTVSGVARGRRLLPATAWDTGSRSSIQGRTHLYSTQREFLPAGVPCTASWGQRIVEGQDLPQNIPDMPQNTPDMPQNVPGHGPASLKMTGTELSLMIRWSSSRWLRRERGDSC